MANEGPQSRSDYWNANVPLSEETDECPSFLRDVDDWDKQQLGTRDVDYDVMSWEEVSDIVHNNRLEQFKRIPSELRRYRRYIADVKATHGSVMEFILQTRLAWKDISPRSTGPLDDPGKYNEQIIHRPLILICCATASSDDFKILYNDWPYGLDAQIVHLVVWTKAGFEEDPASGDLTDGARELIDEFVEKTFREVMSRERVLWFKNWASLKSVHAIEHFHVLLYAPDDDFVEKVTGGDMPLSKRRK